MSRLSERITSWSKVPDINTRQTLYQIKDVIRLLEDALAALRPGLSGSPEAGDTVNNFFGSGVPQLNDFWYYFVRDNIQQPPSQRTAGITWRTLGVAPDRMEFQAGTTTRYYLSDYLRTAVGGSLGFSEARYTFDESQAYADDPAAATWRGLDVAGTVTVQAGGGSGTATYGPEIIVNGEFENWDGGVTYPLNWRVNVGTLQSFGPSGFAMDLPVGGGGWSGADVGDNDVSEPWTILASQQLYKNRTYRIQFYEREISGAANFSVRLNAWNTATHLFSNGTSTIVATVDRTGGVTSWDVGSAWSTFDTTFQGAIDTVGIGASGYALYTITFSTAGMPAGITADPFYFTIRLGSGAGGEFDALSVMEVFTASTIDANLTERFLTLDSARYAPTLTGSGDTLAIDESTGAWLVPTMAPRTVAGSAVTVAAAYGAVTGYAYDAADAAGTLTTVNVFGHYALRPEWGTAAWNIGMAANAGLWTAFRTGTQAASIGYRLPVTAPAAGDVLVAQTGGALPDLAWAGAGTLPGGGSAGTALAWLSDAGEPGADGWPGAPGTPGAAGATGTPGAAGLAGRPGIDGADGLDGEPGPPGAAGTPGAAGATGAAGTAGAMGMPGFDGSDGADGFQGAPGTPGATGSTGPAGVDGAMGRPGADGSDGEDGQTVPGAAGQPGAAGLMGPPGLDGDEGPEGPPVPGPQGTAGTPGAAGAAGATGQPGQDGIDGDEGMAIPGPQGPAGPTGPPGLTVVGMDGTDGDEGMPVPGPAGAAGSAGATGATGVAGMPGLDGTDGDDVFMVPGPQGASGPTGAAGPPTPGPPGLDGDDVGFGLLGVSRDMIRGAGGVMGSGTLNTIAKWTPDGFTLGNSQLVDNGTDVFSSAATFSPSVDESRNLGKATARWFTTYTDIVNSGASTLELDWDSGGGGGSLALTSTIASLTLNGPFQPSTGGIASLGTSTFYWGDLYTALIASDLGSGTTTFKDGDGTGASIRINEPIATGTNYTAFKAQTQTANLIYTLPAAAPTANQVLASSGGASSTLSWVTAAAAGSAAMGPPGRDGEDADGGYGLMGIPTQPAVASGIGGSGTANFVAKFSAATTLANSSIWDDGSNVNIAQVGNTDGRLSVVGTIASCNPAAFKLVPGGGNSWSLNANGGITVTRAESVPVVAAAVNGAVLTCTTAGQQSWTSVLPVANGGSGSPMGQAAIAPCLQGSDDISGDAMMWQAWSPALNVSGADISLPNGAMQSEVASNVMGYVVKTKSNTGAQVNRLQIQSGATAANTQINFINCGTTNFNSSNCTNLNSLKPNSPGLREIGAFDFAWGTHYIQKIIGGDGFNGTDFVMAVDDGTSTASVTLLTVPLSAAPQTATWAPNMALARKFTQYSGVTTAGWGVPAIYAAGRFTAQTAAKASVAAYTVGAADGSFEISANVNVTTSTTHNFTVTCAYTDEGNTARTLTLGFTQLAGATFISAITNVTGAGPYESPVYHIRCKAATAITVATTGTFTNVSYAVESIIKQTA